MPAKADVFLSVACLHRKIIFGGDKRQLEILLRSQVSISLVKARVYFHRADEWQIHATVDIISVM